MNNMIAVFIKQLTSQIKNPVMLIQALIFVVMIVLFTFLAPGDDDCESCIPAYVCAECAETQGFVPDPSMVGLFAVMFVGMTLVGASSSLVLEDKTTQNLRFMTMSGVKPFQYLVGTLLSIFILVALVMVVFSIAGGYFRYDMLWFMLTTLAGAIVSILFGVAIGLSKYPIFAHPLGFILGFGPMLTTFNEDLARYTRFIYNQQVNLALTDLDQDLSSNFIVIAINGLVVLLFFLWMHRKGELRW